MPESSTLDERLAEIDERLRALQSDLDTDDPPMEFRARDDRETPASQPDPQPVALHGVPDAPPDGTGSLLAQLRELSDAHERLLELHRDLLSQYADLLERRVADTVPVSIVAGPFADHSALRDFERDLGALPGVTGVTTREFLSGDRVTLDVRVAHR